MAHDFFAVSSIITVEDTPLLREGVNKVTGYAQVYGKYNTTPYDKLQMDLMYIAHPSLIEDLKIMLATVKILFMPESTEGVAEGATTAMGQETK